MPGACIFSRLKRTARAGIVAGLGSLWLLPNAAAAVLDQSFDPRPLRDQWIYHVPFGSNGHGDDDYAAQTFTVGITGRLVGLALLVGREAEYTTTPLQIDILPTTPAGDPIDDHTLALASLTVPASAFGTDPSGLEFAMIDLDAGLAVNAGDILAIALSVDSTLGGGYFWEESNPDAGPETGGYAAGTGYYRSTHAIVFLDTWVPFQGTNDLGFQTFVEPVPLPGALLLMLSAAPWLLAGGRARPGV